MKYRFHFVYLTLVYPKGCEGARRSFVKKGIEILKKLPVIETVIESFKFPVTRFAPLLKRTAIPITLIITSAVLLTFSVAFGMQAEVDNNELRGPAFSSFGVAFVLMLASMIMLFNGTIQVALRNEMGNRWFSFGGRELRYLLFIPLAILMYMLIGIVGIVFYFVGNAVLGSDDASGGLMTGGGGFLLAAPICFALVVYIGMRLMPLYGYIAIENRFDLFNAWSMSDGNFWRIIASVLLLAIVQTLLMSVASFVAGFVSPIPESTLQTAGAASGTNEIDPATLATSLIVGGAIQIPAFLYTAFASLGLYGFIYKHLKEGQTGEPVTLEGGETA